MEQTSLPAREAMNFDIVIVGAGPAGLSAAIALKQRAPELSIVIVEKAAQLGGHILSGAVIDPSALDTLLPNWREDPNIPIKTKVTHEKLLFLTKNKAFSLPHFLLPKKLQNQNNYIISLANLCRWLGEQAEKLGVEIYPGFSASEILFDESGKVKGIATGDMGLLSDGTPSSTYMRGIELLGKYTLIAEGARGSLAKHLITHFSLDRESDPQKYGLGIKEIWEIDKENHREGEILHSCGWPLDNQTGGGGFLYHMENGQVSIGLIVHLDYKNPYLSPFQEFQRFKMHPSIAKILKNGKRLAYGARALTEGGLQSIPQLTFPGGALLGCAAGYMNVARLKGVHNAIFSGIAAADEINKTFKNNSPSFEIENSLSPKKNLHLSENLYQKKIIKDLYFARNVKPLWSKFGTKFGLILSGFDLWCQNLFRFSFFKTLKHSAPDFLSLKPASYYKNIIYPKPDNKISFDILSSVFLSNTHHSENAPCHLKISSEKLQENVEHKIFQGPSQYYCPAQVYEWIQENGKYCYRIHAQNCLHCKTCDIKDPNQNITWTCPQGGEGPSYPNM